MNNKTCHACGSERFEQRRLKYLYSREGKYLLAPNVPAEVCLDCGMIYYDGPALLEVERRFFAIYNQEEEPEATIEMPTITI